MQKENFLTGLTQDYVYNIDLNCYTNLNNFSLPYTDGDNVQKYINYVIKNVKDKSEFSKELRSTIKDWPSFYYLSPIRNNIFRPITKYIKGIGLEACAGMGAHTYYLSTHSDMLYALEGSLDRASIVGKRCDNLANVKVIADNIMNFKLQGFDFITFIGALEYAACFSNEDDPFLNTLKHLNQLLNDDGFLIIAIENKLGLKYIAGSKEDCIGIAYTGIQDCYEKNAPRTFTRQKLISLLKDSGFKGFEFYYPFPDYKQPKVIIHENALSRNDFNLASFVSLGINESFPQDLTNTKCFSEEAVWGALCENNNLSDFSNSFLIVATKDPATFQKYNDGNIAYAYSSARDKEFATEVKITSQEGKLCVVREKLYKNIVSNNNLCIKQNLKNEPYIEGKSYYETILPIVNTPNFTLSNLANWASPWINYLLKFAFKNNDTGKLLLPEKFLDCTPTNLIINNKNEICPFDFEWKYKNEFIPLLWVVHRGFQNVFNGLDSVAYSNELYKVPVAQIICNIISLLGLDISDNDLNEVYNLENELQSDVTGFIQNIAVGLNNPLRMRCDKEWYENKIQELLNIIYVYDDKLNKLESSCKNEIIS